MKYNKPEVKTWEALSAVKGESKETDIQVDNHLGVTTQAYESDE